MSKFKSDFHGLDLSKNDQKMWIFNTLKIIYYGHHFVDLGERILVMHVKLGFVKFEVC